MNEASTRRGLPPGRRRPPGPGRGRPSRSLRPALLGLMVGVGWAAAAGASPVAAQERAGPGTRDVADLPADFPAWVHEVGARRVPAEERTCRANDHGARADTSRSSTAAIQAAIDACAAAGGGVVTFERGGYRTGALFLKSGVHLRVGRGVTLYGSHDDAEYPVIPTRVAGIEMPWPAGLLNVDGQENVRVSGGGTIDGRGEKWWDLYWTLRREEYEPRGLRWAVDYDAQRVRLVVVSGSSDVTLEDLHLKRSGFWTVQVLYSDHVTVDGLTISDNQGPSTDGINIDSSRRVLVSNNDIDNNDDNICLKAGRDADGLRVARPTEHVLIRDNLARRGGGVLCFGSETSGGIRNVVAYRNRGAGTNEGIRFKSARTRGGFAEDILIRDLRLTRVPLPISVTLDWNPSYSYATLPPDTADVPAHWVTLASPVEPPERGLTRFSRITIEDVRATGARRAFTASGLPEQPVHDITLRDVRIQAAEPGFIEHARDWTLRDVVVETPAGHRVAVRHSQSVDAPRAVTGGSGVAEAGAAGAAGAAAQAAPPLPSPARVVADLRLANDYFMERWPDPGRVIVTNRVRPSNIWTRAVYYEGLMALHRIDPRPGYIQYAVDWGEAHGWGLRDGHVYTRDADNQAAGQTYIELYQLDPRPERIRIIQASIDSMMATSKVDDWFWIDAIQMAMPVFAQLGVLHDEPAYFRRMYEMYRTTRDVLGGNGLYNADHGLWWRDADFVPPHRSPAGKDVYWSRGNGWVIMALARVLEIVPPDTHGRDLYVQDLRAMAEALVPLQRVDGYWGVSLHDPTHFGGPESSGTAMFTYGMTWGINHGILDRETYLPVVARAWHALTRDALHDDGFLGWVQSTGKEPADGQPVTRYMLPDFEDYALGAFLLAGIEVYRLAGGR
jgi:polygalacturonase/rhamnogalacturonyl hydrolase YesR